MDFPEWPFWEAYPARTTGSLRPLPNLFRRAPLKLAQMGVGLGAPGAAAELRIRLAAVPHAPKHRSASDSFVALCCTSVHYHGIGLGIAPSLGYCTGMQNDAGE